MFEILNHEAMYPGAVITTGFGWDKYTFPKSPRIHHAIDRAGLGKVRCPIEAASSKWMDEDSQGCSVLRLLGDGVEIRMLHFIKSEMNPAVLEAAQNGKPIAIGTEIGPTGNKGLSVSSTPGGSGRHLHYQTMLEPMKFDEYLSGVRSDWAKDKIPAFTAQYGRQFTAEVQKRGIVWMSDYVIYKRDAISSSLKLVVDSVIFFDL